MRNAQVAHVPTGCADATRRLAQALLPEASFTIGILHIGSAARNSAVRP
jgi:hypothetical protein